MLAVELLQCEYLREFIGLYEQVRVGRSVSFRLGNLEESSGALHPQNDHLYIYRAPLVTMNLCFCGMPSH